MNERKLLGDIRKYRIQAAPNMNESAVNVQKNGALDPKNRREKNGPRAEKKKQNLR